MSEPFDLKPISIASIPRALEKAERYRLLNEPEQAESICLDILDAEPDIASRPPEPATWRCGGTARRAGAALAAPRSTAFPG
jgi:hypothetical protein